MKFVVIGTGFIFRSHLQAIRQTGGEIVDVCDASHGRGEEWKKIAQNPQADCAVILTPNHLHYPMAAAANDAGKIVLCEKPLALRASATGIISTAGRETKKCRAGRCLPWGRIILKRC